MMRKQWLWVILLAFVPFAAVYFWDLDELAEDKSTIFVDASCANLDLDHGLKLELDKYIESQWAKYGESWLPKCEQVSLKKHLEFIVFYVHGYMGPIKSTPDYSDYAFSPLESALRDFRYVVCNPGLDGRKKYMSFAQGFDAYQVEMHLERLICERSQKNIGAPIICIGHSNGASTLISVLCNNHKMAAQVAGVILLAPYADIAESAPCQKIPNFLGGKAIARQAIKFILASKYNVNAPSPVQRIEKGSYPLNLPTLLAHSKADSLLSYNNFEMLKAAFEIKNKNIQFLSLQSDSHALRRISCELKKGIASFVSDVLIKNRA